MATSGAGERALGRGGVVGGCGMSAAAMQDRAEQPAKLTVVQLYAMEQAARVASGRYRHSHMPHEDRVQAAWLELLGAARTYDPSRGVPFFPYCLRVATNPLRRASIEARSPVSGCKHRVERMRACHAVSDEVLEGHARREPSVDYQLDELRFRSKVRRRLRAVVGARAVPFALAMGTNDWTPREIAEQNGVSRAEVYALRNAVRAAIGNDTELFRLWKDRLR